MTIGGGTGPAQAGDVGWAAGGPSWRSQGYRSAHIRANVTYILLGLATLYAFVLLGSVVNWLLVIEAADQGTLTQARLDTATETLSNAGSSFLLFYVCAGIAFLAWMSRAVDNTPPLGVGVPDTSPTGAIVWWFVPIANLFKPYQVIADLNRRMAAAQPRTWLPLAWWILFIGCGVGSTFLGRLPEPDTIDGARSMTWVQIGVEVGLVVSGFLAIAVVRTIQQGQQARARAAGLGHEVAAAAPIWAVPPASPIAPPAVPADASAAGASGAAAYCPRCGRARSALDGTMSQFCAGCGLDLDGVS